MVGKKGRKKSPESIRATPKRRSTTAKRYFNSGSSNSDSDDEEEFQPPKKSSRKSRLQENSVAKTRKTQDKPLTSEEVKGSLAEPFPFGSSQPLLSESESSDDDNSNANLERKHFSNAVQSKQRACGLAGAKNQRSKPEVNLKGKSKDTGKEHESKKRSSDYQEGKSVTNTEDCKQLVNNSVVKVINESKPVKCDASIKTESKKAEQQTRKSLRKTKNSDIVCKKMEEDDKNMTKKKRKLKVNENENNLKPDGKRFAQKKMKDVANVPLKVQKYLDSLAGSSNLVDVGMSSEGIESDSEDDWQDVHEADIDKSLLESPKKNENKEMTVKDVAVSLKVKSLYQSKSRKNREKFLQCVERTMRKFQNEVKTNLHKSHLVCLVARQILLNRTCNDLTLKALWLSLIPTSMLKLPTSKWELAELRKFLNWFQLQDIDNLHISLQKINRKPKRIPQIQLFVAALRAIGLQARLVMSLQPITWKVDNANLFRLGNGKEQSLETKPPVAKLKNSQSKDGSKHQGKVTKSELEEEGMKRNDSTSKSPYFMTDTSDSDIKKELQAAEGIGKKKSTPKRRVTKAEATVIENVKKSAKSRKTNSKEVRLDKRNQNGKRMRARKKIDYKETDNEADDKGDCNDTDTVKESCEEAQNERKSDDDDDDDDDDDFIEATKSSRKSIASKLSERREKRSCMPSVDRGYARKLVKTIDDDDEFDKTSKPVKFRKSLNNKANSPTVKVISSDSESCQSKESLNFVKNSISACDTWCEVYLKSVKKWTCVELANKSINEPSTCERNATQPLIYVLGIDNENAIKDVTCRYSAKFMSKTRKLRIDREWWAQTLHPYETKERKRDNLEDTELKMNLMQQPFPTTIGEFKNHPLYVLEGDLLKFEAIYPESPAVLGYFRNKAIYSRDCVHILHTRENWLKEARVVKQGEKAYKIVRGRPKRNTPIHERDKVKIDLFGLWQTEVYKPPPVKDGKVPRNEYGNVELFQPSMLPPGGVHVPIQGIHKTARKLGIDAAPAMMGWDFHGGCAHPIIEGVVVAAEFEEKLLDAWQKDEDERERKLKEKKEKKIIERWKLLVKGLNVRERIRKKYNFMESEDVERLKTRKDSKSATDVLVSWPLNKQEGTSSLNETGHCHVFPDSSHKQNKITGEWTKSCSCGLSLPFEKL
ncbi:DNA repair protein complementing XP-C cells homolog [Rhopilema esculentum]|uniref:DNA repair protein complementing XP-C cells homolog n=1 Tax=Rhopilema esculentum TaxID=499914 RepID=UPI0031DDA11E